MSYGQRLNLRQVQSMKQILSPQMVQMLGTFQLSYSDLVTKLEEEGKKNVFVEIKKADNLKRRYSARAGSAKADFDGEEGMLGVEGMARDASLQEHLLSQLDLCHLVDKDYRVAEALIGAIDSRGYILDYPKVRDDIVSDMGVAERKVGEILKIVHTFEPDGIGARNLRECLLLQIEANEFDDEGLKDCIKEIVSDHLQDIGDADYEAIATELGLEEEEVEAYVSYIKHNLNPSPGSGFATVGEGTGHIIPSIKADFVDGKIKLQNLEEDQGIQIQLSEKHLKMLEDPELDKDTRDYLLKQFKEAKAMVDDLKRRKETLQRLVGFVMTKQKDFMAHGKAYIKPLLQREVAEEMDLSPSTVSRIVSSKYVITPYGTLSLKDLCPRRVFGKTKERVKGIILDLSHRYPNYSDQQLVQELKEEFDLEIARRTVAKYRALVDVPNSYERATE